jgi:hypothetical protein
LFTFASSRNNASEKPQKAGQNGGKLFDFKRKPRLY